MKTVWVVLHLLSAVWWASVGISTVAFTVWLFRQPKFDARSRWRWWTLSGIVSRSLSVLAFKLAESPSEVWPIAVFAYGLSELHGVTRGVKLLVRFHAQQSKKLRKSTSIRMSGNPVAGVGGPGTRR